MTKWLTTLAVATMAVSIAGPSFALNPQPLPPRCATFAHCDPIHGGGGVYRASPHNGHPAHCKIVWRHHHRHRVCRR